VKLSPEMIAINAVKAILNDLQGRKGLGDEWDAIDEDIRDEIIVDWEAFVVQAIREGDAP